MDPSEVAKGWKSRDPGWEGVTQIMEMKNLRRLELTVIKAIVKKFSLMIIFRNSCL
jgi:hypothetical protein